MTGPIRNPIPGTTRAANDGGYDADSGLDILVPVGTPCYAVADGTIIYSEPGHTPWITPPDTPNSVLIELAQPFEYQGHQVNFAWYTHLSRLFRQVPDGSPPVPIKAGEPIGWTGVGNNVPHLHLGLIDDRAQTRTMPQELIAQLVWDGEQPAPVQTSPAAPAEHHAKLYLHDNRVSAMVDGKPVGELELRLLAHADGSLHAWVRGGEVKAKAVTVEVAY